MLTPLEIQQKVFRRAFRGYDMGEVDDFLDQVSEELARLRDSLTAGRRPREARITPNDIQEQRFHGAMRGYDMTEVDLFLDLVAQEFERLERGADPLAGLTPPALADDQSTPRLGPQDIEKKEFRWGLRGYDMGEVDDFLDRAAEELARLEAEAAWPARDIELRDARTPRLSSRDVNRATFSVSLRGYDMGEVDIFLQQIAESLERAQREALLWRGRNSNPP